MPIEPSWEEIIADAIESRLLELHTCTIGQVKEYDAATQRAVVFPVVPRVDWIDLPERVVTPLPGLFSVPVVWPRGGGYALHFPIKEGDFVLLVFAESDVAKWRSNAKRERLKPGADIAIGVHQPQDLRRHSLASPFAIAGVFPEPNPIEDAPADHAVLIVPEGGKLRVSTANAGHTEKVALAEKVAAQLTALKDAISNAAPVANDGGAALKTAILGALAGWPESVASTTLEAEGEA